MYSNWLTLFANSWAKEQVVWAAFFLLWHMRAFQDGLALMLFRKFA